MKMTLERKSFLKALELGGTFAGKSKTMPILDCVKIKLKGNSIRVISTDMENFMSITDNTTSDNENEAVFCVSYKDLYSYVKLIKDDLFEIEIEGNTITIKHKKGKTKLPLMDADEFPEVKNVGETIKVSVPSALLNNWIVDARNFTGNDELRQIMNSILFYCKDGELGCCSSDGHSLYWNHADSELQDFEFKLNKNAFNAVCKLCSDCEEVRIEINDNNVKFNSSDACVLARQLDAKYPNFKSVIPNSNNIQVEVNKNELLDALNRCKLSASMASPTAKFEVDGMNLNITCQDLDFNRKSIENMMVSSNGNVTIGFNTEKLITLLGTLSTEQVILSFSDESRPMLAKNSDDSSDLLLLMPVILN